MLHIIIWTKLIKYLCFRLCTPKSMSRSDLVFKGPLVQTWSEEGEEEFLIVKSDQECEFEEEGPWTCSYRVDMCHIIADPQWSASKINRRLPRVHVYTGVTWVCPWPPDSYISLLIIFAIQGKQWKHVFVPDFHVSLQIFILVGVCNRMCGQRTKQNLSYSCAFKLNNMNK